MLDFTANFLELHPETGRLFIRSCIKLWIEILNEARTNLKDITFLYEDPGTQNQRPWIQVQQDDLAA